MLSYGYIIIGMIRKKLLIASSGGKNGGQERETGGRLIFHCISFFTILNF